MANDPFELARRATKKAFRTVGRITRQETDPDLKLFQSLQPQHFVDLIEMWGEGPVIEYIRDMESQLVMRRHKGGT